MLIGDSRGNPSQAKRRAANQLWKQGHWTEVILLRSEWLENYTVGQAVGRQSGCWKGGRPPPPVWVLKRWEGPPELPTRCLLGHFRKAAVFLLSCVFCQIIINIGLSWWLSWKESACNTGDLGSIPGSGRFPGGAHGNPLQHSCLENPIDRGAWWATVHGIAKSQTRLND